MNGMTRLGVIVFCAVALSACSAYRGWFGSDKPMMNYVLIAQGGNAADGNKKTSAASLTTPALARLQALPSAPDALADSQVMAEALINEDVLNNPPAAGSRVGVEQPIAPSSGVNESSDEAGEQAGDAIGYLIAWSPEFNAAFVGKSGKGCIQPATYVRLTGGSASLPADIIGGAAGGNLSGTYSQTLDKLITVTNQTTLFSIGMYGLCQLNAGGGISKEEMAKLTADLIKRVISMTEPTGTPQPPTAPASSVTSLGAAASALGGEH